MEFYTPMCDHCKKFEPTYAKAAAELEKKGLSIGKIDASKNKNLAKRFGVSSYPTLLWMKPKDGSKQKYSGPRTVDAIVEFVSRQSLPSFQQMECDQFDKIVNSTKILMAYIGEADNALFSEAFIPYSKE